MRLLFPIFARTILAMLFIVLAPCWQPLAATTVPLTGPAADVYRRAQSGKWFAEADKLHPDILPTSDEQSFIVAWKATEKVPKYWIVSLHGSKGFATDDLAIWHPHLKNRDVGVVSLQWWTGTGDTTKSYYTPLQIYREIDLALQKLGIQPGTVLFHGFSRGAANSYAVAAIDAGRGRKYFSLCVASSGGVGLDYPPTRAILDGAFGDHPLKGTRWITAAGAREGNPVAQNRDGIPGMKRTAAWLREQGASVIATIEDPDKGHGALMLNPKNAQRVLELFLARPPSGRQ